MTKIGQFGIEDTFRAKHSSRSLTLRSDSFGRGVDSLTISDVNSETRTMQVRPEDIVGIAVAALGIGRIDARVNERAKTRAEQGPPLMTRQSDDSLIEEALVNLRAVMIRRERASAEETKLTKDAYALYTLAFPGVPTSMEEFEKTQRGHWVCKLKSLRGDVVL